MDAMTLLITPLVASAVGLGVWFVQSRIDALRRAREDLQADQRKVYSDVLEPYIRMFAGVNDPKVQTAVMKQIVSFDYKKTAFEFSLIGSDEVVHAFNDMMQFFYRAAETGESPSPQEMLRRWGGFLLAVRKDIGNPRTKLTERDMLRGMITDIDRMLPP